MLRTNQMAVSIKTRSRQNVNVINAFDKDDIQTNNCPAANMLQHTEPQLPRAHESLSIPI
jgi:hypothetical protein